MDDVEDDAPGNRSRRQQHDNSPKLKYMKILQDVADRVKDQIVIELDDLHSVTIL